MAATYATMAHVSDVLERIAVRGAALDQLHAQAAQRAHDQAQLPDAQPEPTSGSDHD